MSKGYVVKKVMASGKILYLHPDIGFCVENCNGGVYVFNGKSCAKESLRFSNKYRWCSLYEGSSEDFIITYAEYLAEREEKLDYLEECAKKRGISTHRENGRLYIYLTGTRFGKTVAMWNEITLEERDCFGPEWGGETDAE